MNTHALDSILGDGTAASVDDGNMISVTTWLSQAGGAVLAEILRTDVISGEAVTELVRLGPSGQRRTSVVLDGHMDATEHATAKAMIGQTGPALVQVPDATMQAMTPQAAPLADAINALGCAQIDQVVTTPDWCAVLGRAPDGAPMLWATPLIGAPALTALPLEPLDIQGWRQLNAIQVVGDTLYAALADPVAGFDVFCYALNTSSPAATRILTDGAQRFALNAAVSGMVQCRQGLLLGTAAMAGPAYPVGNWGPELLVIPPQGSWDLIVGQPRFSPDGLLLPASTRLPGMGQIQNAAIRALASDDTRVVIAVQDHAGQLVEDRREARIDLSDYSGPLRLYSSSDLEDWDELPHSLPSDVGAVSCLCLTQDAVVLGHEALGADALPVKVVPIPGA